MAIDPRLAQVSRVTALRRDKAEREMAQSAAAHRAREEALEAARLEEAQSQTKLDMAHQIFRDNPSCPQTQLWRQISKEKREEARGEVADRVTMRDESEEELVRAKVQFQRANERHRLSEDTVRKAKIDHARAMEEKEADEMQGGSKATGQHINGRTLI